MAAATSTRARGWASRSTAATRRTASAMELGGEVLKVAARIRTATRAGERRPARQRPQRPLHPLGAASTRPRRPHAPRRRRGDRRARLRRAAGARARRGDPGASAQSALDALRSADGPGVGGARRREARWTGPICSSRPPRRPPDLRPPPAGDPRRRRRDRRRERRAVLRDRARDPRALAAARHASCSATRTARSATCRAPSTIRRRAGTSTPPTPCPDLIFQVHPHPVALHPDSERRVLEAAVSPPARAPRGRSVSRRALDDVRGNVITYHGSGRPHPLDREGPTVDPTTDS